MNKNTFQSAVEARVYVERKCGHLLIIWRTKWAQLNLNTSDDRTNRVRNETLWKETDVSSSVVRNFGSRALWWYGHIEWMKDAPKNVSRCHHKRKTAENCVQSEKHILSPSRKTERRERDCCGNRKLQTYEGMAPWQKNKIQREDEHWTRMPQDKAPLRVLVNTERRSGEFPQLGNRQVLKEESAIRSYTVN
jgi:hypothetical protein